MPRYLRPRGARALALLLAVVFLATPALSGEVPDAGERPNVLSSQPVLHGFTVDCPGQSPFKNVCETGVREDACRVACALNLRPGLGFTGRLTATLYGKGSDGSARYITYSCSWVALTKLNVGDASTGPCDSALHGTAERRCPQPGQPGVCEYYLWAPLKLRGEAAPGILGGTPAGSWVVRLEGS